MLTCWDNSAYRVHRTPLPAASVQVFNDTYGKYFQASGQGPEFRVRTLSFPPTAFEILDVVEILRRKD